MRTIGIQEIEDIALGAALLGAGGGGDPYVGKLVAIGAVQACGPCERCWSPTRCQMTRWSSPLP